MPSQQIAGERRPEQQIDDDWITSGKFGSKETVLVFRTSVLNQRSNESNVLEKPINGNTETFSTKISGNNPVQSRSPRHNGFINNNILKDEDCVQLIDENSVDTVYKKNMPAFKLKITYKFLQTETKLLKKIFTRHGLTEAVDDRSFSILWTGIHVKPDILRSLTSYQRINHFPRSYELTRKDRLYKNIERMKHLHGAKHFNIIPRSFILPAEYKDLLSEHNKYRGPWIVKPAALSRGRGIFITTSPEQIPQEDQLIVSKYISSPLCIDGYKCDLRLYILVTSFDPLVVYIYEEGLVRLATVKYNREMEDFWNPCMHLCNYSINKYHTDYIQSNDASDEDVGHKWTLSALLRHLKSQGCNTDILMSNIEDLIIKSLFSSTQSILSACHMFMQSGNNCFELFGFDILIDDTLKPWLLEINLSPSMNVDSPLDAKVKANLIADVLTCVGIPAYSESARTYIDCHSSRFRRINKNRKTYPPDTFYASKLNRMSNEKLPASSLTLEEKRIVHEIRLQNSRRGGLVRIFPTEDTMQRYSQFLDTNTGIPLSTSLLQGQTSFYPTITHNYNQILFNNLYGRDSSDCGHKEGNLQSDRFIQYERPLEKETIMLFSPKKNEPKCSEAGKCLRQQIMNLIESGSELTQLQARQIFSLYLQTILRRLISEPRDYHERLILRFLNRIGGANKGPAVFRETQKCGFINKARTAMIAKLLNDFLDQYNRDTEVYEEIFDNVKIIPAKLIDDFLTHAQEDDLESVLVFHTKVTGSMPYLYNRYGTCVPAAPPIPPGANAFLKTLPAMVLNGTASRDFNKVESYYKNNDRGSTDNLSDKSTKISKRGDIKKSKEICNRV